MSDVLVGSPRGRHIYVGSQPPYLQMLLKARGRVRSLRGRVD